MGVGAGSGPKPNIHGVGGGSSSSTWGPGCRSWKGPPPNSAPHFGSWQSKNQKKQRSAARLRAEEDFGAVPHSFVFHRGRVGRNVRQLSMDLRRVMEPYTARALKVGTHGWGGGGLST